MPTFNAVERDGKSFAFEKKTGEEIFEGEIACLDTTGLAVAAKKVTGLKALGRVEKVDEDTVLFKKGCFRYQNDSSDPITNADVGADCFIASSTSVSKTNATNTKSKAGIVFAVEDNGVWVIFN